MRCIPPASIAAERGAVARIETGGSIKPVAREARYSGNCRSIGVDRRGGEKILSPFTAESHEYHD
jgi:hypothetical protein